MEASQSLKNVPKEDCPIVMVYKKGRVVGQFSKLKSFCGPKTTSDVIEWDLSRLRIITTKLKEDPRPAFKMNLGRGKRRKGDDSDDDFDF